MDQDRDATGRMTLTPMVRIPMDGDEDFKWAIKQVLDLGGFGVIVPHVDTAEEADRLVRAVRYPPARDAAQPEPRGERGWGPGGAIRRWQVADAGEYYAKAGHLAAQSGRRAVRGRDDRVRRGGVEPRSHPPDGGQRHHGGAGRHEHRPGLGPAPGPENHPEVEEVFTQVRETCQAQDRVICGIGDGAARLQQRIDEGWGFILPLGG